MEQGDHAVKSPWGNWQFGINEFYNNWQGRYKGHGDKVKDVINMPEILCTRRREL